MMILIEGQSKQLHSLKKILSLFWRTSGPHQLGVILLPRHIWQCLDTFLVAVTGGVGEEDATGILESRV